MQLDESANDEPWTCAAWRERGIESHEFDLLEFSLLSTGSIDSLKIHLRLAGPAEEEWALTFEGVQHLWIEAGFQLPDSEVVTSLEEIGLTTRTDDVFRIGIGSGMAAFRSRANSLSLCSPSNTP